jgi:hypothetical protein
MNLADFRAYVDRLYCRRRGHYDNTIDGPLHAAIGMAEEGAEVLGVVKKSWVYGKPLDEGKLMLEAGDAFHYLVMLCIEMGWTLEDVAQANWEKLRLRYPDDVYTDAAAIARKDQAA